MCSYLSGLPSWTANGTLEASRNTRDVYQLFPVSQGCQAACDLAEYLTLLEAMERGVGKFAVNDFYYLSRSCLIKDERNLDKFDRIFGKCFEGLEFGEDIFEAEIPEEWLRKIAERVMSPEEMAQVESLGGWEKLMETLRERLAEQEKRHDGGNRMIGTGGTSPFGAHGFNPEGIRIGQEEGRHGKAVKVWDKRQFKIWMTHLRLAPETSRWRFGGYVNSPGKVRRPSLI